MNEVHTRAVRPTVDASYRPPVATSIVVPAFEEMHRLPDALPRLVALVDEQTELIFVDDCSADGTARYLADHAVPGVKVVRLRHHRGKGAAVRAGMSAARGRSTVFMDADLATDVVGLDGLLSALQDAHVAIGSRSHPESRLLGTTRRRSHLGSRFNMLTKRVTAIELGDTQCGFKAFRADAAKLLFHFSRVDGFAFDVELLCLARALGFRVAEVPVVWTERPGSKIRPLRDPLRMATDVLRTRVRTGPRGAIAVCHLRSRRCDVAEMSAAVLPELRVGDVITLQAHHVEVVLPCTAMHDAESVAARLRTVVRDAETTVEPVPARRVLRELCAATTGGATELPGPPAVQWSSRALPA